MNHVRARLDKMVLDTVPKKGLDNVEKTVQNLQQHPLHLPSLHKLNQQLSAEITRLESKVSQSSVHFADIKSISKEFHDIQPELAKLVQIPMHAIQDTSDDDNNGALGDQP